MLDAIAAHILDEGRTINRIGAVQVTAVIEDDTPTTYRAVYRSEDSPLNRAILGATHEHGVRLIRTHNI